MESDHPTLSVEGDLAGDDDGKSYLFMKEDDFSYETFQELKASFKMSVWIEADGKRHKHGHYESREYKISEIVQSEELHRKMDTIIVEELHLTKLALMMFSV